MHLFVNYNVLCYHRQALYGITKLLHEQLHRRILFLFTPYL